MFTAKSTVPEYRVREIKRWIVTRYHAVDPNCSGSSEVIGHFDNHLNAHCVAAAMRASDAEEIAAAVAYEIHNPESQVAAFAGLGDQQSLASGAAIRQTNQAMGFRDQ